MQDGTGEETVGRFAPSPTGRMHLGNVLGALLSWLSVRSKSGRWLLRIEDIDPERAKKEYADWILRDLEWLGLTWDSAPVYQSRRGAFYENCLQQLKERGLVYPCFCTRADIMASSAPHESDGRRVYRGTCRKYLTVPQPESSRAAALRLLVPNETLEFTDGHYGKKSVNLAHDIGDFIIRRKDGAWAYQLAATADDGEMGVTEVVRGRDLLLSSPEQIYLLRLLGYDVPQYIHFPLLTNGAHQRLSKRDKALDIGALRSRYSAEEIIGFLAYTVGIIPKLEPCRPEDLTGLFDWGRIPKEDITVSRTNEY